MILEIKKLRTHAHIIYNKCFNSGLAAKILLILLLLYEISALLKMLK